MHIGVFLTISGNEERERAKLQMCVSGRFIFNARYSPQRANNCRLVMSVRKCGRVSSPAVSRTVSRQ